MFLGELIKEFSEKLYGLIKEQDCKLSQIDSKINDISSDLSSLKQTTHDIKAEIGK